MLNLGRFFSFWRKPRSLPPAVAPASTMPPTPPVLRPDAVRTRVPARPAGSGIAYRPDLVDELKAEHAALVDVYTAVDMAMKKGQWREVSRLLGVMRGLLTDHLLKERVLLYCYLQNMLPPGDTKAQTLFHGFKVEMGSIGKAAFKFVDAHASPEVFADEKVRAAFFEQYAVIGKVLVERIHREETQLYPMYRPTSTATH
ncbi:MAG TPA: hemerythrin domain-containing protein [Burkholderiaceae bacterium]|nr:hemerythrin domain-containing protein [Burkholderiaceae bacterium]